MDKPQAKLGNKLLIAMNNTHASLTTVRAVAGQLSDPAHTEIKLMHYIAPIMWEYGGGDSSWALEELRREEEQIAEREHREEQSANHYFEEARSILQNVGVPSSHIHTEIAWEGWDVPDAIRKELAAGNYSMVVIGRHHHNTLKRLLGLSLADVLRRHVGDITVWVVEDTGDAA
jgi:nucleotide-binding universal stress UspA family protein